MSKILWMILFLGAYVWVVTSGNDEFVINQGKAIYQSIVSWLEDAELDFHVKKEIRHNKKKSHRWD